MTYFCGNERSPASPLQAPGVAANWISLDRGESNGFLNNSPVELHSQAARRRRLLSYQAPDPPFAPSPFQQVPFGIYITHTCEYGHNKIKEV